MSSSPIDTTLNLVTCCYVNKSDRLQIGRITNIPHWHFEKVILPKQRLIFEAPLNGKLEIHTGMMITAIISDTIPCRELQLISTFPVYSYQ
ncbi:MAG: hypothetical protein Tsb0014_23840 [Pleurocapsa sp.]